MTIDHDLAHELDRALADLPTVPAAAYVAAGRSARRRRRATAGVAVAAVVALAGVTVATVVPDDPGSPTAVSPGPGTAAAANGATAPEPDNPVTAVDGLAGVDHYSTTDIPEWAQEYGGHGPVAINPDDGRLWVAPEAEILHTVVDPYGDTVDDITRSYAVEADFKGVRVRVITAVGKSGHQDGRAETEQMFSTTDFELWVDEATAHRQGRPSLGARLVRFEGPDSDRLVPLDGVRLVRQAADVPMPAGIHQWPQTTAAEVEWNGQTWFVLAQVPEGERASYSTYEPELSAPDFDSFVEWLGVSREITDTDVFAQ